MDIVSEGEFPLSRWIPSHAKLPDEQQAVTWIAPNGGQVDGVFAGGWFVPIGGACLGACAMVSGLPVGGQAKRRSVEYLPSSWKVRRI